MRFAASLSRKSLMLSCGLCNTGIAIKQSSLILEVANPLTILSRNMNVEIHCAFYSREAIFRNSDLPPVFWEISSVMVFCQRVHLYLCIFICTYTYTVSGALLCFFSNFKIYHISRTSIIEMVFLLLEDVDISFIFIFDPLTLEISLSMIRSLSEPLPTERSPARRWAGDVSDALWYPCKLGEENKAGFCWGIIPCCWSDLVLRIIWGCSLPLQYVCPSCLPHRVGYSKPAIESGA